MIQKIFALLFARGRHHSGGHQMSSTVHAKLIPNAQKPCTVPSVGRRTGPVQKPTWMESHF